MSGTGFEILQLSKLDPETDIIIMYVNVGKMPPQRIKDYLKQVKQEIDPMFNRRGFEVLYIPTRDGEPQAIIDIVSKARDSIRDHVTSYEDAMKFLENK